MRAGLLDGGRRFARPPAGKDGSALRRMRRALQLGLRRPVARVAAAITLVLAAVLWLRAKPARLSVDAAALYALPDHAGHARSVAVVAAGGARARLGALLASLERARYPAGGAVALVVFVRADAAGAARAAVDAAAWSHGPKELFVYERDEVWMADVARTEGVAAVVFGDVVEGVSPGYFEFLEACHGVAFGGEDGPMAGAPVMGTVADALVLPKDASHALREEVASGGVPARAVRANAFLPAASVFAPSRDAWMLFITWLGQRPADGDPGALMPRDVAGVSSPGVPPDDVRNWFAAFVHMYGAHVVYHVSEDGRALVTRGRVAQASARPDRLVLAASGLGAFGEKPPGVSEGDAPWRAVVLRGMPFAALHGMPGDTRYVPYDAATVEMPRLFVDAEDARAGVDASADLARRDAVERVARFARARGASIAFTLVTDAFVETTYSWICNVLAVDALPRALVFGASDEKVVAKLEAFFANDTRVSDRDVLVVDLSSSLRAVRSASAPEEGLDFGSREYWLLMLERTALLRDVLDAGVGILHFETDQIWFGDPMPEITSEMGGRDGGDGLSSTKKDMVLTINTRGEASGNFFYLMPTLRTRHLWALITTAFQASYLESLKTKASKDGKWHYISNDQSLFTKYGLGSDWWFNSMYPVPQYAVLDKQRFVDGTWYLDFEDDKGNKVSRRKFYTTEASKKPIILNNNFMIGVGAKKLRAQRFGHWFWDEAIMSCNATLGSGPGKTPVVPIPPAYVH